MSTWVQVPAPLLIPSYFNLDSGRQAAVMTQGLELLPTIWESWIKFPKVKSLNLTFSLYNSVCCWFFQLLRIIFYLFSVFTTKHLIYSKYCLLGFLLVLVALEVHHHPEKDNIFSLFSFKAHHKKWIFNFKRLIFFKFWETVKNVGSQGRIYWGRNWSYLLYGQKWGSLFTKEGIAVLLKKLYICKLWITYESEDERNTKIDILKITMRKQSKCWRAGHFLCCQCVSHFWTLICDIPEFLVLKIDFIV